MKLRRGMYYSRFRVCAAIVLVCMMYAGITQAAVMPDYQILPSIDTNLAAPTDVALDRTGNVFVAESSLNRIQIFTSEGIYVNSLTGLERPICVTVDVSDRIYACNKDTGSVAVFDSGLAFLFKLGWQDGVVDGEFAQPNSIAITAAGLIYVADSSGDVIKTYNPDGSFAGDFSPVNSGGIPVAIESPSSITIQESTGNIIVLDHPAGPSQSLNTIHIFTSSGVLITEYDKTGTMVGDLHLSQHITVDSEDRLYVTDSFQNITLVYDKNDGSYLGDVYDAIDRVRTPLGLTIGSSGKLYVTSLNTGKVKVFQITEPGSGLSGDCNGDGIVDAGDISALVLEIFDGDGNLPADAPGGTFPGDAAGSDANGDGIVDAGDISCVVLLIFNGPGACGP